MWLLLLILLSMGSCSVITLVFGLLHAGRRADEGEERILEIMSSELPDEGDTVSEEVQHAPPSSKLVAVK